MKVTFPHMGNTYICVKALLDDLNVDYIIPPYNNKKALEIGTRHAPELACLPLKINIGNFMEAYEKGADTILMAGGRGPCRFGYYGEMHNEILRDLGLDIEVINLEVPNSGYREFLKRVRRITGTVNIYKISKAILNATRVSVEADNLEKLCCRVRPREIKKGEADRIFKDFMNGIGRVKGSKQILKHIGDTRRKLLNVRIDEKYEPLRVGIVGEIFTSIDWYANFNLEKKLGEMGVEADRAITTSGFIIEHMIKNVLHIPKNLRYAKAAEPFLRTAIGGHAQETIGNMVLYAENGYDGVIQIYPLTCMPEIVAESIIPAVQKKYNIPVLTLIIDEMTGESGYQTRLEAFVDLLNRRKELSKAEKRWAFSGN